MNTEVIHCTCCRGRMISLGAHGRYLHVRCPNCGHERFFDQCDAVTPQLYETDADYNADLDVARRHEDLLQWNHVQAISRLEELFDQERPRVLDVGCFNGFFVKELRDRGYDAIGVDFNKKALDFGRVAYKLDEHISTASLAELERRGERFGVITLFEVLEHLEDFALTIEEALRLLLPNGLLIVSTPNSNMTWRPKLDAPPHHLSRFSPMAVKCLMKGSGLTILFHAEQTSWFDLLRHYVGSQLRRNSVQSMRGGEFRSRKATNLLRTLANRLKWPIYWISKPLDRLLHAMGIRYISQIVIARKSPS